MSNVEENFNRTVKIDSPFITLQQLLKSEGIIHSGGIAKMFLTEEFIYVNDSRETRRGRKLYPGDKIRYVSTSYLISTSEGGELQT